MNPDVMSYGSLQLKSTVRVSGYLSLVDSRTARLVVQEYIIVFVRFFCYISLSLWSSRPFSSLRGNSMRLPSVALPHGEGESCVSGPQKRGCQVGGRDAWHLTFAR
jgi:hypothetical protein